MSGSKVPSLQELDRPQNLKEVLASDKIDDCLWCRATGASAFITLGIYSYISGRAHLEANRAQILKSKSIISFKGRQAGITGIALSLVGMGLWRFIN